MANILKTEEYGASDFKQGQLYEPLWDIAYQ